ncbi:GNAT family N-acetyltransferase [Streptomyces sp. NL15-2K]|uniref:GNAT family N-acetyltransferase n=1 Tax=Streptomyces sp. NL15-2K TaxID=376149 RepID=UPI000F580583|nr:MULTISPECIES: GNAT family N-acetyltransferase [Actinomycetes]WKX10508.1 GNAT family N-acetyltransferase [Kutzneria buriramensis]
MREMTATVRQAEEKEWDALDAVLSEAYGRQQPPDVRAAQREIFEFDRALVAEDEGRICGCVSGYALRMSVPGSVVPAAGVTWCGVLPTHRRRGMLTQLMRRQLTDIHERWGEPVAALFTTEPPIYGRYGYGTASHEMLVTVPRWAGALVQDAPSDPSIRLTSVDPLEAVPLAEPVHAVAARRRPGMLLRGAAWARHAVADPPSLRGGSSPLRCVLAVRGDEVLGFVRYATIPAADGGIHAGTVRVREICAVEPAAGTALWRHVLDLDLTAAVVARIPVDDPLLRLLVDPRSARPTVSDQLHLRLVDVGRALAARTYAADVDVVLEVRDSFCPWNAGRWRLSGGRDGAACEATGDPADVSLGARELGAVYLGGTSVSSLAEAGLVEGRGPAAVARLSRALVSDLAPFTACRF